MDDTIVIRLTIIMIHTAQYNEIILLFFTILKTSYKITSSISWFFQLTESNCIIIVCTKVMYLGQFPKFTHDFKMS